MSYHPSLTSSWVDFPFNSSSIADVFDEATYSKEEFFDVYALNGNRSNVEIESSMHFSLGRCYTMKPKVSTVLPVSEVKTMLSLFFISKYFF